MFCVGNDPSNICVNIETVLYKCIICRNISDTQVIFIAFKQLCKNAVFKLQCHKQKYIILDLNSRILCTYSIINSLNSLQAGPVSTYGIIKGDKPCKEVS